MQLLQNIWKTIICLSLVIYSTIEVTSFLLLVNNYEEFIGQKINERSYFLREKLLRNFAKNCQEFQDY
jgi:hypothetical protein